MTTTITKEYKDFPAAHRQPKHGGHCRFIHGHNYDFVFEFGCTEPDANGFVVDFGQLFYIKEWLTQMFDHTCLVNADDPLLESEFLVLDGGNLIQLRIVPNSSAEGIALLAFQEINTLLAIHTHSRAFLVSVTVYEDSKNAAIVRA